MITKQQKKKYTKVSNITKKLFIFKVIVEKRTIKQASKLYKINYSTAKTIIRLYKTEHSQFKNIQKEPLQCFQNIQQSIRMGLINKECTYRQIKSISKENPMNQYDCSTNQLEKQIKNHRNKSQVPKKPKAIQIVCTVKIDSQ